jgi:hypothetical protein
MLYSTKFMYIDRDTKDNTGGKGIENTINYEIAAAFLPYKPVSLEVDIMRSDSTVEGWGTYPYEATSNSYGARLNIAQKKLPPMRIEFNHWDYTVDRNVQSAKTREITQLTEKTEIDRFSIHSGDRIKSLRTSYILDADFLGYSSSFREYAARFFRGNAYTIFSPSNSLSTNFTYSDIEISKIMSYGATLHLSPVKRFHHSYSYDYLYSNSSTEKGETFFHTLSALFNYRFNSYFRGKADLGYRTGIKSGIDENYYNGGFTLEYRKPVKGLMTTSNCSFSASRTDKGEDNFRYLDYSLGFGIVTRNLTMGKLYSTYSFSYREYESTYVIIQNPEKNEQFHSESHQLRSGVTGRGPGRTFWTVEAEGYYFKLKNGVQPAKLAFWAHEGQWSQHLRHYTMTGEVGHPLASRGTVTLRSSYTTGESDSKEVQRYRYEGRMNYPVYQNLNVAAWYKEEWWSGGWYSTSSSAYRTKSREYHIDTYYRWKKVSLSLEYNVSKDENAASIEVRQLFLRLSRPF